MRKVFSSCAVIVAGLAALISGCSEPTAHNQGVYMLIDTSGTYKEELKKAQHIINFTLAKLNPGDSFAVARVNTGSFSEKNIIAKVTFDSRPSQANEEKRRFRERIDGFVQNSKSSAYTDITGGVLQAIEYLNEKGTGRKTILIFSDLKEELRKGYVRDIPLQLAGFEVVALNVTKLHSDNVDPREYMDRLTRWESRVKTADGAWRVINDLERLEGIFAE